MKAPDAELTHQYLTDLLHRAGVLPAERDAWKLTPKDRVDLGPVTQERYEVVLQALAFIRMEKVQGYGESRYRPEGARYNLSLAYGDLERKMIRIKHALFSGEPLDRKAISEEIPEAAGDLANYAVMMVELCMYLLDEGMWEQSE